MLSTDCGCTPPPFWPPACWLNWLLLHSTAWHFCTAVFVRCRAHMCEPCRPCLLVAALVIAGRTHTRPAGCCPLHNSIEFRPLRPSPAQITACLVQQSKKCLCRPSTGLHFEPCAHFDVSFQHLLSLCGSDHDCWLSTHTSWSRAQSTRKSACTMDDCTKGSYHGLLSQESAQCVLVKLG